MSRSSMVSLLCASALLFQSTDLVNVSALKLTACHNQEGVSGGQKMVRNDNGHAFIDTNLTKLLNKLRTTQAFGSSFRGGERCNFAQCIIIEFNKTTDMNEPVKAVYNGDGALHDDYHVHAQLSAMSSGESRGTLHLNKGQGHIKLPQIWEQEYERRAQIDQGWRNGGIKRHLITCVADAVERQRGEYLPVEDVGAEDREQEGVVGEVCLDLGLSEAELAEDMEADMEEEATEEVHPSAEFGGLFSEAELAEQATLLAAFERTKGGVRAQ